MRWTDVFSRDVRKRRRLWKDIKRDLNSEVKSSKGPMILYFTVMALIFFVSGAFIWYNVGYDDGVVDAVDLDRASVELKVHEDMMKLSVSDVQEYAQKKLLLTAAEIFPQLFVIIVFLVGVAWVIHGVGFRIA